jgi:hypothetical protein
LGQPNRQGRFANRGSGRKRTAEGDRCMHQQVTVETDTTTTVIKYRWFAPTIITTVIVPGVLFAIPTLFVAKLRQPVGSEWVAFGLCVLIWSVCVYVYLAKLLNTTEVRLDESCISVAHSPVPWWPQPTIDRLKVDAVLSRTGISEQDHGSGVSVTVTGEVIALVNGSEVALLKNLASVDVAYDIASQIRQHLKR